MKHGYSDGFNVTGLVYNVPEVIAMSARVESILRIFAEMTDEEWEYLLVRLSDKLEVLGWQKVSGPAFRDWDSQPPLTEVRGLSWRDQGKLAD